MLNIFNKLKPNYNKKVAFLLILVFCIILFSVAYIFVSADEVTFAGGDGTSSSPYQIEDCSQLQLVASTTYLSAYFIVNNDIDCSATNPADPDNSGSTWDNGGLGFSPIGNSTNNFTGNFNGNGKKISGLYINRITFSYSNIGLFGYTGAAAVINKVGLVDATVNGYNTVGGLVAYNKGTISQSYAIADVFSSYMSSGSYIGGLIGINDGTISDCFARGTISRSRLSDPGAGLIGRHNLSGSVSNSYAAVVVKTTNVNAGLISNPTTTSTTGTTSDCFWDINVSGKTASYYRDPLEVVGATTTVMHISSTYTSVGWDFDDIWGIDSAKNNGYPYLRNVDPGNDEIIEIDSIDDLQNIKDAPGKRYLQTADIDASTTTGWNSGLGFEPIATFYGQYNGNGYTISNLFINRSTTDYIGLFGINMGILRNIKLVDNDITGDQYTGSLVGFNWGFVFNSAFILLVCSK
jgi:hypothetical protein